MKVTLERLVEGWVVKFDDKIIAEKLAVGMVDMPYPAFGPGLLVTPTEDGQLHPYSFRLATTDQSNPTQKQECFPEQTEREEILANPSFWTHLGVLASAAEVLMSEVAEIKHIKLEYDISEILPEEEEDSSEEIYQPNKELIVPDSSSGLIVP